MTTRDSVTVGIVCLLAGFVTGWQAHRERPQKLEPPAPAIIHKDGSLTLERTQAKPPPPLPEPPGTIARTRAAIIQLAPIATRSEIQLDLVTIKDGTQRITAKGPGIIGGMDYPIMPAPATVHKWTVAGTWDGSTPGAMILRKSGPINFGAMAQKNEVKFILGITF